MMNYDIYIILNYINICEKIQKATLNSTRWQEVLPN
jgi:hypothetical protein